MLRILKQPTLQRKSNNLRDSPQTGRKPFSHAISLEKAQFYGTQTKTWFSCNIAERSLFTHTHTQKNALFYVTQSSNQPQIAENTPKHVFDKLEREKRISCRETWQRLFWERWRQCNLAKNRLKHCFKGKQIKNMFSQFAASHADFSFILLKTTVLFVFG